MEKNVIWQTLKKCFIFFLGFGHFLLCNYSIAPNYEPERADKSLTPVYPVKVRGINVVTTTMEELGSLR